MGFNDARRFPDFSLLSPTNTFDSLLDAVVISHFHLDHCGVFCFSVFCFIRDFFSHSALIAGALPHFTEICGYNGPIYMTHPTKAICPILVV